MRRQRQVCHVEPLSLPALEHTRQLASPSYFFPTSIAKIEAALVWVLQRAQPQAGRTCVLGRGWGRRADHMRQVQAQGNTFLSRCGHVEAHACGYRDNIMANNNICASPVKRYYLRSAVEKPQQQRGCSCWRRGKPPAVLVDSGGRKTELEKDDQAYH